MQLAACLDVAPQESSSFITFARTEPYPDRPAPAPPAARYPVASAPLPPFLAQETALRKPPPVFVARERELAELAAGLETAGSGKGQILFVIGGAGRGKTMLVQEFARRAQAADPELIVVGGYCNAHAGLGDPYLPFREVLTMLTGEVQAKWAAGLITAAHARRLWELMPLTVPALVKQSPDLIGSFVPAEPLLERAAVFAPPDVPWFKRLTTLTAPAPSTGLEQKQILAQYTALLKTVAAQRPLLLILEDLHWVDASSNALLFHLSREVANDRILIVGSYRPDEVALSRGEVRHPLADIMGELKRRHGDIWLDLGDLAPAEGQRFVAAYLDTQPNRLGRAFREALFRRTQGHALFTVELLREMQERGDVRQDAEGYWVAGETIDWARLPARVEGVIEQRIGRLTQDLQAILTVASVEGETFTAEAVAHVRGLDERGLVQQLSRELDKQHRLVTSQALDRVGQQRLSFYRFRHYLFQHYLYHSLDELERAYLHEAVGLALEALYGDQTEPVAVGLARHFEQAGLISKTITYLLQAADRARQLFALAEALQLYGRAIDLAQAHPQAIQPQTLLALYEHRGDTYSLTGHFDRAISDLRLVHHAACEAGDAQRERALLIRLGQVYRKSENLELAVQHFDQALELARAGGDQRAIADTLYHLGTVTWDQANIKQTKRHHQEAVEICRKLDLSDIVAVQAYHGLGEATYASAQPRLAIDYFNQSLALARQIGDRAYESENLVMMAEASLGMYGEANYQRAQEYADEALAISEAAHLEWHTGICLVAGAGLAQGCVGNYQQGLDNLARGLKWAEDSGLAREISIATDSLGYLLQDLNLLEQAKTVHSRGLETSLRAKSAYWLPRLQANLAIDRLRLGDRQNVEQDLGAALTMARDNGQEYHAIRCLEGLAEFNLVLGNVEAALYYADELLRLAEPRALNEMVAQAHRWRGEVMLSAGQLDAAETELKQAAALATDIGRVRLQWDVHAALHRLYKVRRQAELAHQHETIVRIIVAQISHNLQKVEWRTGLPTSH
jgi:predicted ATPase